MRYFWGLLLGTVFAVVATVGFLFTWAWAATRQMHRAGLQGEMGFDIGSMLRQPIFWIVGAVAFSVGFALAIWKSNAA